MESINQEGVMAAMVIYYVISFAIGIAFYVLMAIPLMKIGNKLGYTGWFAWVPILNLVLIIQIAKKTIWYIVIIYLLSACVVGIVFLILTMIAFFKEIKQNPQWTWALLCPPLLLIPLYKAAKEV